MSKIEKVAKWLFEDGQERTDGDSWDSIQGRPLWEKVIQRYLAKAKEILSLIDQQAEPEIYCLGRDMAPDEEYDDDFCDLYESSEIGAPCEGRCYYAKPLIDQQGKPVDYFAVCPVCGGETLIASTPAKVEPLGYITDGDLKRILSDNPCVPSVNVWASRVKGDHAIYLNPTEIAAISRLFEEVDG